VPRKEGFYGVAEMNTMTSRSIRHGAAVMSVVAVLAFVSFGFQAEAGAITKAPSKSPWIIQFTAGTDARAEAASLRSQGNPVSRIYSTVFPGVAVNLTDSAAAALARNPKVQIIERDGIATRLATQSPVTWGLDRVDQRSRPLSGSFSYDFSGVGVSAYVIDTGILAGHSDFGGRVRSGFSAIADGRGTSDCNGHGTHVSGTIAGATYGIAKSASLVAVRVLDCAGSGSWSGVIAGLDWVAADHVAGVPAVANMSLGGGASSTVDSAVQALISDGVTVAVAAGNSNADACATSPARVSSALTVGATDSSDTRATFSNFGSCVDIFAPGVSITSDWNNGSTSVISGTSMASPHVAGVAAVLLSQSPAMTPSEITTKVIGLSTSGVVANAGSGSPNRLLYLSTSTNVAVTPSAPSNVTATALSRGATLSWTKGADGGSPLTGQTITIYRGATRVGALSVSAAATSAKVTGLKQGWTYSFTVNASNAVGTSAESARSNLITALR
jgi:subtilisin family serine protease